MKRTLAVLFLAAMTFGYLGCGGSSTATTSAEKAAESAASAPAEEVVHSTGAENAAATVDIPADAPPDEVVTAFLEARRAGDASTTAGLLTSVARAATAKHKIDVNGDALPDLQFQVAKPKYLKNNPKGAHVSSIWSELLPDGKTASYEVVWVLRKEEAGWRVAGFAAELTPGTQPQFLNFEDPEDMMRKQQEAMAAAQEEPQEDRTAAQPENPNKTPPKAKATKTR